MDTECTVKIADFGLARSLTHLQQDVLDQDGCLTDYVATRWYRAPEILLGCKSYTTGVDLWSLGCILGEMLLERPLYPGNSTLDQVIDYLFSSAQYHLPKMVVRRRRRLLSKHTIYEENVKRSCSFANEIPCKPFQQSPKLDW